MTGTVSHQKSDIVYANLNLKIGSLNIQGQGKKNEVKLRKIKKLFNKNKFDLLLFVARNSF